VLKLADKGYPKALIDNVHLRHGLNVAHGMVACQAVAEAHNLPFESAERLLGV
jgi:alanine dehydrogenase